jgi:outer membrane biosynthesis protein TonB
MRYSLPISLGVHAAIVLAAVIVLPSPDRYQVEEPPSIPVDIVSIEELSQRQATIKALEPKKVAQPAPPKVEPKDEPVPESKPAPEVEKAQREEKPEPPAPPEPSPPDAKELEKLIEQTEAAVPVETKKQAEAPVVKPKPRPRPPAKKKREQLDVEKVAALLNKLNEDRTAPPERQLETGTPQQDTFNLAAGSDARMSADELDWLRQKVRECWNPPVGVTEAESLQVHVQIELDRSGSVSGAPQVVNHQPHPLFDVAAASAVRAVLRCQPYDRVPPEKYESWHSIILNFDPRVMFSG